MRIVLPLVAVALAFAAPALGASARGDPLGESCAEAEGPQWTTEKLHDWVSFADELAVIDVLGEVRTPPPSGPEGYAGYIGRRVTIHVERVLWRRRGAARGPASLRVDDFGWFGTVEHREPARFCRATRLEVGRRYLAPVVRYHHAWFPFSDGRLLLDGDLVVGGVDGGEPSLAHNALAGRTVAEAAALVRRTAPYRAAVRHRGLSPPRRWNEVDRDDYRVWRTPPTAPVEIARGVTSTARWLLFARRPGRGRICLGMRARPLWGNGAHPVRTRCLRSPDAGGAALAGTLDAGPLGRFAFGPAGERVADIAIRFAGRRAALVPTRPATTGLRGRTRFWTIPAAAGRCIFLRPLDLRRRPLAPPIAGC